MGLSLIFSGVDRKERTKEGVAIVLRDEELATIDEWEPVNLRIISADIVGKITVIQAYAPTDNSLVVEKDQFYDDLQNLIDKARNKNRKVLLFGDLNARTDNEHQLANGVME